MKSKLMAVTLLGVNFLPLTFEGNILYPKLLSGKVNWWHEINFHRFFFLNVHGYKSLQLGGGWKMTVLTKLHVK